jgi:hypothetical protein
MTTEKLVVITLSSTLRLHQWVSEFVTHPKSIIYLWLCNATRFKNSELRGIFAILESIPESDFVRFQLVLVD